MKAKLLNSNILINSNANKFINLFIMDKVGFNLVEVKSYIFQKKKRI